MNHSLTVAGVALDIEMRGTGRPLLFLHPGEGLQAEPPLARPAGAAATASSRRIIPASAAPRCPTGCGTVDDLAYLYLDLAGAAGAGATRCWPAPASAAGSRPKWRCATRTRFAGLVLADPLGIKVGGVLDRDIADMHAIPRAEFMRLAWADPAKGEIDYTQLPDTELAGIARGREAFAAVRLEALHAQPAAEALAAPHRHSDAAALGRAGRHRLDRPTARPGAAEIPGAQHGNRSRMPAISRIGNSPRLRRPRLSRFIDTHY